MLQHIKNYEALLDHHHMKSILLAAASYFNNVLLAFQFAGC